MIREFPALFEERLQGLPIDHARYSPIARLCSLITGIYYMNDSTDHKTRLALLVYSRINCVLLSCLSAQCGGRHPKKKQSKILHTDNLYMHDVKEITLHMHEYISKLGLSLQQTLEEAPEKGFDEEHTAHQTTRSESNLLPALKVLNRLEQRRAILPNRSSVSGHKQRFAQGCTVRDLIVCCCVSKMTLQWYKPPAKQDDDNDDEGFGIDDLRRMDYL